MISVWSVTKALEDMGVLSAEDTKKAMPLCIAACGEMSKRLKSVQYEDEAAVIMACAGLVLYKFTLMQSTLQEDFSSFKAGDVTVSRSASSAIEGAAKFRDEALICAAQFLTDVDFVFEAVEA